MTIDQIARDAAEKLDMGADVEEWAGIIAAACRKAAEPLLKIAREEVDLCGLPTCKSCAMRRAALAAFDA